jgi:hypothetical protein
MKYCPHAYKDPNDQVKCDKDNKIASVQQCCECMGEEAINIYNAMCEKSIPQNCHTCGNCFKQGKNYICSYKNCSMGVKVFYPDRIPEDAKISNNKVVCLWKEKPKQKKKEPKVKNLLEL